MRPFLVALIAAIVAVYVSPAIAQSSASLSYISMIRTGWDSDSFAIVTQGPIWNPANCSTPDGYISEMSFPGYNTYYSAALAAYAAKRPVVVTVHNTECFAGRPKIIGINLPL